MSNVVFNVTVGQNVVLGGAAATLAGSNIPCMCLFVGV